MVYIVFLTARDDPACNTTMGRWGYWLGRWTCLVTRSPLAHCAVIHADRVVECVVTGTYEYQRGPWLSANRWQLHGYYGIVEPWPVLTMFHEIASLGTRDTAWWRYELGRLCHWLTRGSLPWWQCTGPPLTILDYMGLSPPRWLTTPIKLKGWLDEQGFCYHEFSASDRTSRRDWRIGES